MEATSNIDALQRAITILGGQQALAKIVGRTQPAVSWVIRKSRDIPAEWCPKIEAATAEKGECISRQALRPDLWPSEEVAAQ